MKRMQAWLLLAILGAVFLVAFAGCTAKGKVQSNDNDNNDSSSDSPIGGTVNARGSPGWGLVGALGGLGVVAIAIRKLK